MHNQSLIVKIALAVHEMRLIPNDLHDLVHELELFDSLPRTCLLLLRVDKMQRNGSRLGIAEQRTRSVKLILKELDDLLAHLELSAIVLADLPGQRILGKEPLLRALMHVGNMIGERDVDGVGKTNAECALSVVHDFPGQVEIALRNRLDELIELTLLLDGRKDALDLFLGNLGTTLNVANAQSDDYELAAIVILRDGDVIVERLGELHDQTPPQLDITVFKTKNPS